MHLSWEWKLFLLNTICQGLFFMYSTLSLLIGFNVSFPYIYKDDSNLLYHRKLLAWFIFSNLVGNYLCIKYKSKCSIFSHETKSDDYDSLHGKSSCDVFEKKSHVNNSKNHRNGHANRAALNLANWVDCQNCNTLAPPRSKHCGLCQACVLKRDHHCFFAGCCIGFHNQRHFIIFCLYGSLGAAYSTFATSGYLKYHYSGLQDWGIVAYLLPVLLWFWLTGSASGSTVLMVLFLYWSFFSTLMCFYFFVIQMYLVYTGQTRFECKKSNFQYCSTFWNNMKSVFGPSKFSFISFLIPSPFIGHFGDGKSWDELDVGCKFA